MKEFPLTKPRWGRTGLVEDRAGQISSPRIRARPWASSIEGAGMSTITYAGRRPGPAYADLRSEGHRCSLPAIGTGGQNPSGDRHDEAGRDADGEQVSVRHPGHSKGVPWYVDFRGNRVGSVDPVTMKITEHTLPPRTHGRGDRAHAGRRRLGHRLRARLPDGSIPTTGGSRNGRRLAAPVAAVRHRRHGRRDLVQRIGVRPNTLVRSIRRTEKFQTWIIPAGGGVVRNMMVTRDGDLALAESGSTALPS